MALVPLRLTSTSFLLPGNTAWSALGGAYDLDFGSYGDWPATLMTASEGALVWVLFLEDVVIPESLNAQSDPADILAPLLGALDQRLAEGSKAQTVVAWSSWRGDSPLRQARALSPWLRIARAWKEALYARTQAHPSLFLVDLDDLFAAPGMDSCFDARNWYAAHCRLSRRGIELVARALSGVLTRAHQAAKKVLVLDCDNTLWGGVVGEVGLNGLVLGQDGQGQVFADFQRAVAGLIAQGLIVCLASKNNEQEVWNVFDQHPGMILKRDQIISARIDWNEKADNVLALATELSLGLDSFVFWDDNQLERERMRQLAPKVLTPEIPVDVAQWANLLNTMDALASFTITQEDLRKTEQYRSVSAFAGEKRQAVDENTFLTSLALHPTALPVTSASLARAAQLCAKTNQYNLRTIRHNEAELAALRNDPSAILFLTHLSDRFGDHGLVALTAACLTSDPAVAFLDSFMLSCRVLGRHLESWILSQLIAPLENKGARWLVAEYRPTPANVVAKDFLKEHGFTPLSMLSIAERDQVLSACRACLAEGSDVYAADLSTLVLPYLEPFRHDPSEPHAA